MLSVWRVGTVRLFEIGRVPIDIHLTSSLAIASGAWGGWILYGSVPGIAYGIFAVFLLFGCLLLHELAHALLAHKMGLKISRIIFLPIGLLLEIPPALPRQEMAIALVGPLTNLVVGVVLGIFTCSSLFTDWLTIEKIWTNLLNPTFSTVLLYLTVVNIFLGIFNMLPAFPMDGGRVLRAGLALTLDYVTATRIAAWLGRALATVIGVIGVVGFPPMKVPPDLLLLVVAATVYLGAHHEEIRVRQQRALVHVEVKDVYRGSPETLSPWDVITRALVTRLFRYEQILPVLIDNRVVGILTYQEARKFLERGGLTTVAHVMRTDFPVLQLRDTLWVAVRAMTSCQLTGLPVVDDGVFRGMVNLDHIDRAWQIAHSAQKETEHFPISNDISR